MVFLEIILLVHILAVVVAVGAVSVTDYLHLIALKKKKLEKQLKNVYPNLSNLINISLGLIILSGAVLVYFNPGILKSQLFLVKMSLVVIVGINGLYLQKIVSPNLDVCVLKGTKHCPKSLLYKSSISGSISIVTWFGILILALTKNMGYNVFHFIMIYLFVLVIAVATAVFFEEKARKWRD